MYCFDNNTIIESNDESEITNTNMTNEIFTVDLLLLILLFLVLFERFDPR